MREAVGTALYGLHAIVHPFDGFWELKHHKKQSVLAATILLALEIITAVVKIQCAGFLFSSPSPQDNNVLLEIGALLIPLTLWIVVNWSITTLFDGKGKMQEIYVGMCYALLPMVLIGLPQTLIGHFLTLDEAVFYYVADVVTVIWCVWLVLTGAVSIQDYTMFKSIVTGICTLLGIAAVAFLMMVFYSAVSQLWGFFTTIIMEIQYW